MKELKLTCKDCGTLILAEINTSLDIDIKELDVFCPLCGAQNSGHRNILTDIITSVDLLTNKGYRVLNVFPKILGIQVSKEFLTEEVVSSLQLPDEFIVDFSEEDCVIIKNGRMQDVAGFDGYTEEAKTFYINEHLKELNNFILSLPQQVALSICRMSIKL